MISFQPAQTHSDLSFPSRRKVIASTGFAAASLLTSANAGWLLGNKDELPIVKVRSAQAPAFVGIALEPLPEEWVRLQGRNLNEYAKYLKSLKMKNISAHQFLAAHAKQRGSVWNSLPPRQWWGRMGYTLRVVDRISSEMHVPVKEIISGYRCPQYNARCAGARKQSWHQANIAIDVKFDTSARNVTHAARALRDRGLFKGGVGSYYSFTHIDTRGQNVNW